MTGKEKDLQIAMELYETDIDVLQSFIANQKIADEFTEEYLILYNFATDCKYSKQIQSELVRYLLPFYLKAMEQAVFYDNKTAVDIYCEFNLAMFLNQENFKCAVGKDSYQYIMNYYVKQTIRKMEMQSFYMLDWVSLFNTTVAFSDDNLRQLFLRIFNGSLRLKYIFFQYLSILLFKESDNLFAMNGTRGYWTSDIWNFDDGYFSRTFFWSNAAVGFFDKEISRKRVEALLQEVKPLIYNIFEPEISRLFCEEMERSFSKGIFHNRKAEYLKKISCVSEKRFYWDRTF